MISPLAVLIGPPGSGKSTVAARLADRWSVTARDTDVDVVEIDGREIGEIFIESGEAEFRALEREAVREALSSHGGVLALEREAVREALSSHGGVLALGGGAILDSETQSELRAYAARGGVIVFLNVGIATAARRVGLAQSRPLLAGSPRAAWRRLMEERRATYESLATITVETDGLSPRDIAARISDAVGVERSTGGAS